MSLFDFLVRGAEAFTPIVHQGMIGQRLGQEDRRKLREEEEEREFQREVRMKTLERAIAEVNVREQRENRLAQQQAPKPEEPNRYTYRGKEFETPEEVRAARDIIDPPRPRAPAQPRPPSASEGRLAAATARRVLLDRIRGRAELLAREGTRVDAQNLTMLLRGYYPDTDLADINAIVSDVLTERERRRLAAENTRSTIERRNAPSSDFDAQLADMLAETDSTKPAPQRGTAPVQAAPVPAAAPTVPKTADERARELHAQGMSKDSIIATLRRERLIQ